jgi:3-oxoacyl-[acyl-carrier protein] reductase
MVFGANGAIGASILERLTVDGFRVDGTSRAGGDALRAVDPSGPAGMSVLADGPPLDAVVWAQGANANDSIYDVTQDGFAAVLAANTTFVVDTLHCLLESKRIARGARLVLISSIWQVAARGSKLSYTVSKSALGGLVRSLSVDLARDDVLVNAVLPGVVDTAMTRGVLSDDQIHAVEASTGFGRLVTLDDVSSIVSYLCSPANTGVTGQSIAVDLGFSHAHTL